jgi:hypothetical protein
MSSRFCWRFLGCVVSSGWLLAGSAGAQGNLLLTNPEFDDGLAGWTMGPSQTSKVVDDSDDCPGSFAFTGSSTGPGSPSMVGIVSPDCIPVQTGQVLELEVSYRAEAPVHLEALLYAGAACTAPILAELGPALAPVGDWTVGRRTVVVQPQNATNARFAVIARINPGPVSFQLDLDRAYLGRARRIFADDFEATSICRWANAN